MNLIPLLHHMAWADDAARRQLADMPVGSAERARAERIYAHLVAAEHVWFSRLTGVAARHGVWPEIDPDEAAALSTDTVAALVTWVESRSPDELERRIVYRNSAGTVFENRAIDVVLHLVMHGAYHRGQLALLARSSGADPASTDFIAWLRGAPAPMHE